MTTPTNLDMPTHLLKDVINPWLLGADPEFAVLTPPDVVVSNAGSNAVNTTKSAGSIGADHNGRVWELRPSPSPSAYVVTINLWKLLRQTEMDKVQQFKWKSGALGGKKQPTNPGNAAQPTTLQGWTTLYSNPIYGYTPQGAVEAAHMALQQQHAALGALASANNLDTLGGHVHFGISGFNSLQRQGLDGITRALLSLDVLPHKENTKRLQLTLNSSPKYGHMDGGDAVRDCQGHVEYRCPPSWLDRPGQALAVLTSYKLAGARPSALKWTEQYALKEGFMDWLDTLSGADVDAWILSRFIESNGFERIQADPASDFKPLWRRETPWER